MAQRSHGVGSNSRVLQNTLAYLVSDRRTAEVVRVAREAYASRRTALLAALRAHGLAATAGPDSLLVWVEVPRETETVLSLAAHGVTVAPGSMSFVSSRDTGLVRIAVTQLPDDARLVDDLAELVAKAAEGRLRGFFD